MYFWSTKALADEIRTDSLSENSQKNYYLAVSIFTIFSIYLSIVSHKRDNLILLAIEFIAVIAITIVGVQFTFKTNSMMNGKNYIKRILIISFPIMIKMFILMLFIGFIIGILIGIEAGLTGNLNDDYISQRENLAQVVLVAISQVLIFWRINTHLKYINQP